ncbi:MAG: ABC transporter permease, partial [Gemmatimonadetes bacterium]|nr:ABC transporter permease [Gemmatimonadota bacterium]
SLGASPTGVVALLLRSGMKLVAVGTVVGLLGALATSRLLESFLFTPEATPVGTWVGVPAVMAAVALGAAWLSARRAGQVSPVTALREE